jgi:Ca-activated chloride channel homolog
MKGRTVLSALVLIGSLGALTFNAAQDPAPKPPESPTTADRTLPKSDPKPSDPKPAGKVSDPGENEEFTIRSDVRLVLLDVSVKDQKGAFVSGLTKDNFTVYEDGKPQPITQFANQDIPVTVGLVVDESGSMRPKRSETITAALTFIQASNPQDEVFVINFNDKVYHGLPDTLLFSDNVTKLREALWSTKPEGRTALYDAIFASLHQLDMGRRSKKTLVLISDGGDNISSHTRKDVEHKVQQSLATIYTVGIFDNDDPDKNPDVLKWLANVSGGVSYFPEKLDDIVPVCQKIAKDIRTRYAISYVPAEGKPGTLRHIKIAVNDPERGKLVARTRTQYVYNPEESAEK